jgi:GST-like protein
VHHFLKFNPGKAPYAEERYTKEARRLWRVLDRRLGEVAYVAGEYSIADIAIWPWIARFAWQPVDFADHPNVKRWYLAIAERPAVERGYDVLKQGRAIPLP